MRTIQRVKTKTLDDIAFGYWDEENEQFVPVETQNDISRAAGLLGITVEMMKALVLFASLVRDAVSSDLIDIWKRLDKAGIP